MKRKSIHQFYRILVDVWFVFYLVTCPITLQINIEGKQCCSAPCESATQQVAPPLADRPRDSTG